MEKLYISVLSFWNTIANTEKEKGATATEYSLLVGLIALVLVGGVGIFGGALNQWFTDLGATVASWK